MKIHSKPGSDKVIIVSNGGESESDSTLETFSDMAQNYLDQIKSKLTPVYKDILSYEEKLQDMQVPIKFDIKETYGGRGIYIIKDSILQDYIPYIDEALDIFYNNMEIEMKKDSDPQIHDKISENIELRKILVKDAILEKIKSFQIDKLIKEYDGGKTKYNCSPQEMIALNRGEETYISHIFNPIRDIEVISRVSGHSGRGESSHGIHISKDVFLPLNKMDRNSNYLANIMGYNTQQELLQALQSGKANIISEQGSQIIGLGSMIKRSTEVN